MITRKQVTPLLLEACPSFGSVWGPIQRPGEDQFIYLAFGAFASHFQGLYEKGQTSEFGAFDQLIRRFQQEGDPDVRFLAAELVESIQSQLRDGDSLSQSLVHREFLNERVVDLRFEGVHFDAKFTGSTFKSCEFIGCRLDRVLMRKTCWEHCRFDHSTLVIDFTDSTFERCSFRGVILCGLAWEYGGVRARFAGCDFSNAMFGSLNLRACKFENCDFSGTRISGCDLRGATHNARPLENVS